MSESGCSPSLVVSVIDDLSHNARTSTSCTALMVNRAQELGIHTTNHGP